MGSNGGGAGLLETPMDPTTSDDTCPLSEKREEPATLHTCVESTALPCVIGVMRTPQDHEGRPWQEWGEGLVPSSRPYHVGQCLALLAF